MESPKTAHIASLLKSYDNVMILFTYIRDTESSSSDLKRGMITLELSRLRFSRWGAAVGLSGGPADLKQLRTHFQGQNVSGAIGKLAEMASLFERVAKATKVHNTRGEVNNTSDGDAVNRRALIDKMRSISESRRCSPGTLQMARWYLLLERIRHKSFRRQCKLVSANSEWILYEKQQLTGLVDQMVEFTKNLEELIPFNTTDHKLLCEDEAQQMKSELSQWQLALLTEPMRKLDRSLAREILELG